MTKQITTFTLVLLLLLAPAMRNASVLAQKSGDPARSKDQKDKEKIQAEMLEVVADARKNATYDESGRMSKATINVPRLGKFDFEYKYDAENRLQYIIDGKGRTTVFEYGENGVLNRITLPDGRRMYELDESGKGVFFKNRITFGKLGVQQNLPAGISGLNILKSVMLDEEMSSCSDAVTALAIAAAAASVACAPGPNPGCIVALGAMAYAGAQVVKACGGDGHAPMLPVEAE